MQLSGRIWPWEKTVALTSCPECDGKVSDQAAACPHCGHPLSVTKADDSTASDAQVSLRHRVSGTILSAIGLISAVFGIARINSTKSQVLESFGETDTTGITAIAAGILLLIAGLVELVWFGFHRVARGLSDSPSALSVTALRRRRSRHVWFSVGFGLVIGLIVDRAFLDLIVTPIFTAASGLAIGLVTRPEV